MTVYYELNEVWGQLWELNLHIYDLMLIFSQNFGEISCLSFFFTITSLPKQKLLSPHFFFLQSWLGHQVHCCMSLAFHSVLTSLSGEDAPIKFTLPWIRGKIVKSKQEIQKGLYFHNVVFL